MRRGECWEVSEHMLPIAQLIALIPPPYPSLRVWIPDPQPALLLAPPLCHEVEENRLTTVTILHHFDYV